MQPPACAGLLGLRRCAVHALRCSALISFAASRTRCSAFIAARFTHSLLGAHQLGCSRARCSAFSSLRCLSALAARPSPLRGSRARVLGPQQLRCFARSGARLLRSLCSLRVCLPSPSARSGRGRNRRLCSSRCSCSSRCLSAAALQLPMLPTPLRPHDLASSLGRGPDLPPHCLATWPEGDLISLYPVNRY